MEVYVLLGFVLILSIYLGLELISKVPSTLHTPLMSGANAISGADSSATGTPSSTSSETVDSIAFSSGYANPEMHPDSGDIIYIENRRPISRASDQTEDVKIIVEF